MKRDDELWARLRDACPGDAEIAPLAPNRAARILRIALAARHRSSGRWWASPIRFATCAAACVLWFGVSAIPAAAPVHRAAAVPVASVPSVVPRRIAQTIAPLSPPVTAPPRLARRIRHRKPNYQLAHSLVAAGRRHSRHRAQPVQVIAAVSPPAVQPGEPGESDGAYLRVSARIAPETAATESLRVTVTRNVPASVPGVAEAGAAQIVAFADAPNDPVPVWAQARVASNEPASVTLTALR